MIAYLRTNSDNPDFKKLAAELEADLRIRDGEDHVLYEHLNRIDTLKHALVAYENDIPVGCGAIREYSQEIVEVKRMYVIVTRRNQSIATGILKNLEQWAFDLKYKKCLLETGVNQPEAIQFYKKNNYRVIPNFGRYENSANSICFEKVLHKNL